MICLGNDIPKVESFDISGTQEPFHISELVMQELVCISMVVFMMSAIMWGIS